MVYVLMQAHAKGDDKCIGKVLLGLITESKAGHAFSLASTEHWMGILDAITRHGLYSIALQQ